MRMVGREGLERLMLVVGVVVCCTVLFLWLEKNLSFGRVLISVLLSLLVVGAGWGLYQTVLWIREGFGRK